MSAKSRNIKSNLKKVDKHKIRVDEYDELPELTDEMFNRAAYKVGGVSIRQTNGCGETVTNGDGWVHFIGYF